MHVQDVKSIKKNILEASYAGQEGHIASSFSVLDIMFVLYGDVMNISPKNISMADRDYFILSKGHASLAHVGILHHFGFLDKATLLSFCKHESPLGGHLDMKKVAGVEVSTGSLGHGIAVAVGMALASKIQHVNNFVYAIVGDGECNEGTFWESLLLGAQHQLDNLTVVIDYNRSNDRAIKLDPLLEKVRSFGWEGLVIDGHDHAKLKSAFLHAKLQNIPTVVIANTIKGKGVKIMEGNPAWHHKVPNKVEITNMLEELK